MTVFPLQRRIAVTLVTSLAAVGCTADIDQAVTELPEARDSASEVIYHRQAQRLVVYDTNTQKVIDSGTDSNSLQYEFPTPSDTYTVNRFESPDSAVVEVTDEGLTTVFEPQLGTTIFPLAEHEGQYYFVAEVSGIGEAVVDRRILSWTEDSDLPVPYSRVFEPIHSGAVVGDILYFTTEDENGKTFTLHSVSADDPEDEAEMVSAELESGRLFSHLGELFTANSTMVMSDSKEFRCPQLCYFHDEPNVLVAIESVGETELLLTVTDTSSMERIAEVRGAVIDYELDGSVLTVFLDGRIERVDLGSEI